MSLRTSPQTGVAIRSPKYRKNDTERYPIVFRFPQHRARIACGRCPPKSNLLNMGKPLLRYAAGVDSLNIFRLTIRKAASWQAKVMIQETV